MNVSTSPGTVARCLDGHTDQEFRPRVEEYLALPRAVPEGLFPSRRRWLQADGSHVASEGKPHVLCKKRGASMSK